MSAKKLSQLALFTVLSLAIYAIESAIPPLVPIPGIKPGLANIITLILLHSFSAKDTLMVLFVRILLSALLFGQAVSLLYSLAGGLLAFLVMLSVHRLLKGRYPVITGIFGGIFHNIGQITAAFLLTRVPGVWAYLPFLILGGILSGLFTGLCAAFFQKYFPENFNRMPPSDTI